MTRVVQVKLAFLAVYFALVFWGIFFVQFNIIYPHSKSLPPMIQVLPVYRLSSQ